MENQGVRENSIWKAIPYSFVFGSLYRDVAKNWKGVGFSYLFLVLLLVCVPRAVKLHSVISTGITQNFPKFIKEVPDFKLEKGQFSVDVKQPYYSPDAKAPIMVIDTTGQITSLSQVHWKEKADSVMLITKNQMLTRRVRFGVPEEQTVEFLQFGALDLNKDSLGRLADFSSHWAGLISYPFLVLGFFIYNIIAMLVYGLIGLALSKMLGAGINYDAAMRLAAVSHTPSLVLSAALFAAGLEVPMAFLAFLLFSTFLLFLAIRAAGGKAPPPLPATP